MNVCGFLIGLLFHFPCSCHQWRCNPMYWSRISQLWEWDLDCQNCCSDRICSYCRHSKQKVHSWFSMWEKVLWMTQNNSILVITAQKLQWLWSYWVVIKLCIFLCMFFSYAFPFLVYLDLSFFCPFLVLFCSWWSRNQLCFITQWPRKPIACISKSLPPVHLPKLD